MCQAIGTHELCIEHIHMKSNLHCPVLFLETSNGKAKRMHQKFVDKCV